MWSARLHICHSSCKMSHLYSVELFSQDSECSANYQSRHTGENHIRIAVTVNFSLSLSFARPAPLVSCALSDYLFVTQLLSLYPTYFIFPLFLSLSFLSLSLSPSLSLTCFISLSLSFPLFLYLAHSLLLFLCISLSLNHLLT